MTDIHAVIAELKALESQSRIIGGHWAKLYTDDAIAALPQLLAYIEKIEQSERDCDSACSTIVSAVCAERDMWEEKSNKQSADIERLEAVARSLDIILRTHSGYECARDALDALERDE